MSSAVIVVCTALSGILFLLFIKYVEGCTYLRVPAMGWSRSPIASVTLLIRDGIVFCTHGINLFMVAFLFSLNVFLPHTHLTVSVLF